MPDWLFILWAGGTALLSYSLVYALRKPFTAAEFEGLSIMSIEASLAGLPVIANSCPGLRDTLPPDWPLCVRGNDLGQYAAIFRNLRKRTGNDPLSKKAAAFAKERFGIRRMQEAYEAVYLY